MPDAVKPIVHRLSPQLYHALADAAVDVFALRFGSLTREQLLECAGRVSTTMRRVAGQLDGQKEITKEV